jgi:hypothetical protein
MTFSYSKSLGGRIFRHQYIVKEIYVARWGNKQIYFPIYVWFLWNSEAVAYVNIIRCNSYFNLLRYSMFIFNTILKILWDQDSYHFLCVFPYSAYTVFCPELIAVSLTNSKRLLYTTIMAEAQY